MLSGYNLAVTLNFNKLLDNESSEDAALFLIQICDTRPDSKEARSLLE